MTGTALVAGGSRGLGLLVARELLRRGYLVSVCARDEAELLRGRQLLQRQGDVDIEVCDVRDARAVQRWVDRVERQLGPVEVAIAVAGIIQVGPAVSTTLEHFDDAIDTMLKGPIHLAWAVLPGMRSRRRGRLGVVTSIGGVVAPPHLLPYAAAKFGAVGFSEGLAAELTGSGVTATTIVPGLMRTGSHERAFFFGDAPHEFAWFGPAASLPLLSMNAGRAARRMVTGVLRGRAIVMLTPLTHVAVRVHGLFPGLTTRVLGVVARLLPDARAEDSELVEGRDAQRRLGSRLVGALTVLGRRAARRNNERRPAGTGDRYAGSGIG